ncbi:MAG: class I SAM-dependent methyltransferase [Leptospirales bacterium]|nr:class I SAM-dependent methyltransferase [Leptospirales bacterium]
MFLRNYRRMISIILASDSAARDRRVLDWGGGNGILSDLLHRDGFRHVTLFDVKATGYDFKALLHSYPSLKHVRRVASSQPARLPFRAKEFDIVISSGVLEHVPLIHSSLDEIYRVLELYGRFFVFHFPQRTSYTEAIARLRGVSPHPRTYSMYNLRKLALDHGFYIERSWRFNLAPKTLNYFPTALKMLYEPLTDFIYASDKALSKVPLLNLLCNSIELQAFKAPFLENRIHYAAR